MIYTLQYLRAIAAILVVITHIAFKSSLIGSNVFGWFRIGASGVDIFFVISGFIMTTIYSRTPSNMPGTIGRFWRARFARIFPLYWLVTSAALVLYLISPGLVNSNGGSTSVWRSYTLIPTYDPSDVQFLIGPGWSLSFEVYFYLLFSTAFLIQNKRIALFSIASTLTVLALGSLTGLAPSYLVTSPLLLEFLFGIVIFQVYRLSHTTIPACAGILSLAMAMAGFFVLNLPGSFNIAERWWQAGVPAALLVLGSLSLERIAERSPSRVWVLLGDASYSVYLVHVFALGAASRIFSAFDMVSFGRAVELAWWAFTMIATVVAGCVTHLLVERPLTNAVRHALGSYVRRKPVQAAPTLP